MLSEAGIDLGLLIQGGCPFLQGPSGLPESCREWQDTTLATLVENQPRAVVISTYTTGKVTVLNSGVFSEVQLRDESGRPAETEAEALTLYRDGLERVVRSLNNAGIPVVVVSAVPDYWTNPFSTLTVADVLIGDQRPAGEEQTVAQARRRSGPILSAEREIAGTPGLDLVVVDPVPVLCTDTCRQLDDVDILYRDQDHLAYRGAVRVAQLVLQAIRDR